MGELKNTSRDEMESGKLEYIQGNTETDMEESIDVDFETSEAILKETIAKVEKELESSEGKIIGIKTIMDIRGGTPNDSIEFFEGDVTDEEIKQRLKGGMRISNHPVYDDQFVEVSMFTGDGDFYDYYLGKNLIGRDWRYKQPDHDLTQLDDKNVLVGHLNDCVKQVGLLAKDFLLKSHREPHSKRENELYNKNN